MKLFAVPFLVSLALVACNPKPAADGTVTPGTATTATAPDDSPALALDSAVRTGTLPNGLTYFIRKHEKPEKRVMLWLAVNAGSVLEDDDQRGLAHFVEHMAFNGTARFEKNTMTDFFERSGMEFGADVNAYTSFDETVYQLQVPTDDLALMKTGWDVLEDWATSVKFSSEEFEKERGVVVEEWRLGRGAGQRIFDKQFPVVLAGSKYAARKPIGDKTILETAPVERIKAFYKDWYRPNNMAVIVVGDIDLDKTEAEITARFGKLDNPESPRERVAVAVPLLDETRVSVQSDKEMTLTQVSVSIKGPRVGFATENDYRASLVDSLFHGMLRARLGELSQEPTSPFAFAVSYTASMGRAVDVFSLLAGAKPGQAKAAMNALLVEAERIAQHGFVESELKRIKAEHLRDLERALAEADTTDVRSYTSGLVNHFLEGEVMLSAADDLALAKRYLEGVTIEDVNTLGKTWMGRKDRVLSAAGPTTEKMPSDKELLALAAGVASQDITPWEDDDTGATLMAATPKPGTIVNKETIKEIGVSVWTLSNGARVVIKPTDFKNDEVQFSAFSPGGHSLAAAEIFDTAQYADGIVSQSGVGEHDEVALGKLLTGKVVRLRPWIDELEEGMQGSASPRDLDALLQLTHLYFTAPRKDTSAFTAWKGQMNAFVKNRDLNPQAVFFDEFGKAASGNHPRRQPPTSKEIAAVDLDAAHTFYKDRFADAGDFTFMFVGNVDEAKLETLAATYLASLPTSGRKEKWRDVKVKPPKGIKKVRVNKGQDPKSFVMLSFHGKSKWSNDIEDDLDMLASALSIRLREILREDMGGVYGVFSNGGIERRPATRYQYVVGFGCSPDNVEKLSGAVFDLVKKVKKEGIDAKTVDKLKQQRKRALETEMKENRFWMQELSEHFRYGTDPRGILELGGRVERVSSERIRRAARAYVGSQYIDAVLMPAGSE